MAKLQIRKVGDECLRKTCRPVDAITPRVLTLLDDMVETMRAANGVGLAAPQVGVLRRIVVIEVEPGEVYELINPRIIAYSGEQDGPEGCLSVPGRRGMVKRPMIVRARFQDRNGEWYEIEAEELLARCIMHETDHLDGVLYVDKMYREIFAEDEENEEEEAE